MQISRIKGGSLMGIKICGKFTKRKDFIYRTDTYIQFGESDEIKGSFVLCNPGSSSLKDIEEQKKLKDYEGVEDYIITGELKEDPTMEQLIKILKGIGLDKKEGRFPIYNIFTLRNGNMDSAIKEIKGEDTDKELLDKDFHDFMESEMSIPWTVVGWGCKSDGNLNRIKKKWLEYLEENDVDFIGYKHDNNPHYYHPRPQIKKKKEEYLEIITEKLGSLLGRKEL